MTYFNKSKVMYSMSKIAKVMSLMRTHSHTRTFNQTEQGGFFLQSHFFLSNACLLGVMFNSWTKTLRKGLCSCPYRSLHEFIKVSEQGVLNPCTWAFNSHPHFIHWACRLAVVRCFSQGKKQFLYRPSKFPLNVGCFVVAFVFLFIWIYKIIVFW